MENKEIYIDGVDVSGCPHIEYEHKWWNMAGHEQNSENVCHLYFDKNADFEENFLCRDNPNCYYKQLKRLEQENKELLETLTKGCYQNLQHECRIWELKESNYRSTLEEIRGYCEECKKYVETGDEVILYTVIKKVNEVLNESN